ncbi:MAG: hypothetical protein WKF37_09195 [Bryobacteraceae bacterium]
MRRLVWLAAVAGILPVGAQTPSLIDILKEELDRNYSLLKEKADPAPYFMSYGIVEQDAEVFSGTLGALQIENRSQGRLLDVSVRVGTPKLDSYHSARGERPQFGGASPLPIENSAAAIRRRLWMDTDRSYRAGAQRLINLRTSTQVNVADEDSSDDFSKESPSVATLPFKKFTANSQEWAKKVRSWSAEFAKFPSVLTSNVSVRLSNETKYLVNTEGTKLQHGRGFARITIGAQAKAADGMDLSASESFEAENPTELAKDAAVVATIRKVGQDLTSLLQAPW